MFEDDVLTWAPDVDSWAGRAEELLELLSELPMESMEEILSVCYCVLELL